LQNYGIKFTHQQALYFSPYPMYIIVAAVTAMV